ncbi:MAG: hypothetical protein M3M96_04935 [Candidatus Eremiobacteraeota bacterium]|nr:hypothetical protein [Candidatus Eremiobacteraeota bacterium]
MNLLVRTVITVLCGVGLYASIFMLRKTKRADRGELSEPSVVQQPLARLFGRIPNAALGATYYPAFAVAIWFASAPWQLALSLIPSGSAALVSAFLACSLVFVTRMPCRYCWTAHAVNWTLAICNVLLLFKISYLR